MDDDLIRRALGAVAEPEPSPDLLTRATAQGTAHRRRRRAGLAAAALLVVIGAGAIVAMRDDDAEIVSVSPATSADVAPDPTSAPPASPRTAASSSTTVAPEPAPTRTVGSQPVETFPSTVPGGTSAPFVAQPQPPALPCDPAPELTADRVTVSLFGAAPRRADGFLQERIISFRRTGIELWSPDGLAATIGDTVPDNPDQWYCPTGLVPLAYDGRFVWATVGGIGGCAACPDAPLRSSLFRVDVTTGSTAEVWRSGGDDEVLSALPADDGSASVLSRTRSGSSGQLAFLPSSTDAWVGERTWTLDGPLVDARLALGGADPLTGPIVTYVTGGPYGSPTVLHVVVLGDRDREITFDLTGVVIEPGIVGVSPDGTGVLVQERWEGIGAVHLVRIDGGAPAYVGSGACWTSSGLIARSTWTYSSEVIYDERGTVELVQPTDLSVVADLGLDTFGGGLACLSSGHVALTAFDAVPGSIVAGSERVVLVGDDGSVELVRDPDLRVVERNAND